MVVAAKGVPADSSRSPRPATPVSRWVLRSSSVHSRMAAVRPCNSAARSRLIEPRFFELPDDLTQQSRRGAAFGEPPLNLALDSLKDGARVVDVQLRKRAGEPPYQSRAAF